EEDLVEVKGVLALLVVSDRNSIELLGFVGVRQGEEHEDLPVAPGMRWVADFGATCSVKSLTCSF
ncbi:hypothetical protein JAO29_23365, partial [Edaphobacter sp. HDX4]|uniref:hypothetical protein n=1 Tax=Edaphobacter sp. HDX4 TaxID=2794064 RepID=UPI002FE6BA54